MKTLNKTLKIATILFFTAIAFIFFYLPYEANRGIPHGNIRARIICAHTLQAAFLLQTNNETQLNIFILSDETKARLQNIAEWWDYYGPANFLIKTNFSWGNSTNREIVIVCTTPFDNDPKPTIWNLFHRNPAHAVGYSDRTTGLISPSAYSNLDLSQFILTSRLSPTNSNETK